MPMKVTAEDVRSWLDDYLRWEAKSSLTVAGLMAPAALLVCFIQFGLADALLTLFLGWWMPKWLLHLAALGGLGLLFVGSAQLSTGYVNDLKLLLRRRSEEEVGPEGSQGAKLPVPGEAHMAIVVLTWVLLAGPELVRRVVSGFARHRWLMTMDREGLAAALACLASADKAVELGDAERAAPQAGPALARRLALVRGVLFIGQSDPPRVGLTDELRRTLRHGGPGGR
jgi:hypothetical protein